MDLLKSIEIFREVCKQMSFSKAAGQLNLVPSAVSRQISELEKHLGIRLLQRTTRSINLTEDGRRYLQKMDLISQSVSELISHDVDDEIIEDHIQLTAPSILRTELLTGVLNDYLKQCPNVTLSTTFVNREINLIEEGYDLALRVGELKSSNLISRTIGKFPLSIVASPDYINTYGEPKHPKDLAKHNCLINTLTQSPHRWEFVGGKRKFSIKIDGKMETNDDAMLQSFACSGFGIAYLPTFIVRDKVNKGELLSLLVDFIPEPLPISIVYPSRQFISAAKRKLIDLLIEHAQQLPLSSLRE